VVTTMTERDELIASSTPATLHWILRVAVAACFIGHGAFGVITKAAWLPYFAIFGIPEAWAWKLMPVVGTVDISVGVLTLVQPVRAVILYMAFWGFQTACLRPLAGQGMWELFERAGNYGVPLAFLCLLGAGRSLADWLSARPAPVLTVARASAIGWILRVTTALVLIGHGGFDFAMNKDWTAYAAAIGISPGTLAAHPLTPLAGWFECVLGLLVLAWPTRGVLLFVFAWKLGTEAFRPLAGEPIWDFIERGGSYGAPIALAWIQGWRRTGAGSASTAAGAFSTAIASKNRRSPMPQSAKTDRENTVRQVGGATHGDPRAGSP
jgi:hypothetical protein